MSGTRKVVTSPQNARIKLVRALSGRTKERREAAAFLAEGVRLVEEALESKWPIRFALYSSDLGSRGLELIRRVREEGIEAEEVSPRLLATLSDTEHSQGVLAVLEDAAPPSPLNLQKVLVADGVRDPGNLGTLIRTAEAAGMDGALLTPGTADAFAPKVVRAGMGAHFRLPIYEVTWLELKIQGATCGWRVYLADMQGRSCWETDFKAPLALVIGGEAGGASAEARGLATELVSIPMHGKVESLNAAVAGAVLMFEIARRVTPVGRVS